MVTLSGEAAQLFSFIFLPLFSNGRNENTKLFPFKLVKNLEVYPFTCPDLTRIPKECYDAHPITVKILKFGTPKTIAIIVLKIEKFDVTLH